MDPDLRCHLEKAMCERGRHATELFLEGREMREGGMDGQTDREGKKER